MDEHEFQSRSEEALTHLQKRLLALSDENDFEVEGGGGKLEIEFDDPEETRFVISPNSPVRQIWISALSTSFKLSWSEEAKTFVLDTTGETLPQVMSRILSQQLGARVSV